jgi:MFS family permease
VRVGVTVAALAMVASAVATQFWMFVLARLLLGLGSGVVSPAIRRIVVVRDPAGFGANLGQQAAYDMAGFVLGPLVAAGAAELLGLRAPFVLMAGLFLAVLAWTSRLDLTAGAAGTERRVVRTLLRNRQLQAALAASVAFYITIGTFEAVWAVLLRDQGAATWLIGVTLSLFTVPMIFLAPIGGREAQRRGPLRVVAVSISAAIVCMLAYGVAGSVWLLVVIAAVHSVADSFTMPGNQVAVASAAPASQVAAALGLLGASGLVTAGTVGLVAGAVYEHAGRFTLFAGAGAAMAVCVVAALVLGRDLLAPPTFADVTAAEAGGA